MDDCVIPLLCVYFKPHNIFSDILFYRGYLIFTDITSSNDSIRSRNDVFLIVIEWLLHATSLKNIKIYGINRSCSLKEKAFSEEQTHWRTSVKVEDPLGTKYFTYISNREAMWYKKLRIF